MSTASIINKLSVPGTGPDEGGGTRVFMPKLNYRFRTMFIFHSEVLPEVPLNKQRLITNAVISTDRPILEFEEVEIAVGASRVYLPGRHFWSGPLEMTLREDVGSETMKALEAQQRRQFDVINQAGPHSGSGFKMTVITDTLNGDHEKPKVLDRWFLFSAFISKLGQSAVEYGTSEVQTISLGIRYDIAAHVEPGQALPAGVSVSMLPADWGTVGGATVAQGGAGQYATGVA